MKNSTVCVVLVLGACGGAEQDLWSGAGGKSEGGKGQTQQCDMTPDQYGGYVHQYPSGLCTTGKYLDTSRIDYENQDEVTYTYSASPNQDKPGSISFWISDQMAIEGRIYIQANIVGIHEDFDQHYAATLLHFTGDEELRQTENHQGMAYSWEYSVDRETNTSTLISSTTAKYVHGTEAFGGHQDISGPWKLIITRRNATAEQQQAERVTGAPEVLLEGVFLNLQLPAPDSSSL